MNYDPTRDIPKAAREIRNLKPTKIVEWIKEHRTETVGLIKQQKSITPQAVTLWLSRHKDIADSLRKELSENELSNVVISEALFINGAFREISSVKTWIRDLTNNGAKESVINGWVNALKRVCQGNVRENENIEGWGLKHPDRLSLEDSKNFIFEVNKRGYRSREWRLMLRNFLTSKGTVVKSTDISGKLEEDAGKFSDLFVSKEKIYAILDYLKTLNSYAYLASKFAYKTSSRLTATLEADAQYINFEEHTITVFEKAVKGKAKKRVVKVIPPDLWEELPKTGKLFPIDAQELNNLLRAAFKQIIPELEPRIKMPFHFWRHMYAQHMLRASKWNYGLVARLGNWSTSALEKYYGAPPMEVVKAFGMETLPQI